mmetsp:Transcript_4281/g.10433  ORF Transcript_4281/g.10433 Transcript_4281/m.10433 type:complete len:212 (-) Transcript_4281:555-1190(-)
MPIQVPHRLHRKRLPVQSHLVALDDFLDGGADFGEAGVDAGLFEAGVGAILGTADRGVILRIERNRERRVDDPAAHLDPEIQLAHVVVAKHRLVPVVGGVVRRDVVEGAARGKAPTGIQPVLPHELERLFFQPLAQLDHRNARSRYALHVTPHLPVHLRCPSEVVVVFLVELLQFLLFGRGGSVALLMLLVLPQLADGGHRHLLRRRPGLF